MEHLQSSAGHAEIGMSSRTSMVRALNARAGEASSLTPRGSQMVSFSRFSLTMLSGISGRGNGGGSCSPSRDVRQCVYLPPVTIVDGGLKVLYSQAADGRGDEAHLVHASASQCGVVRVQEAAEGHGQQGCKGMPRRSCRTRTRSRLASLLMC
jgi:hypothetical protein